MTRIHLLAILLLILPAVTAQAQQDSLPPDSLSPVLTPIDQAREAWRNGEAEDARFILRKALEADGEDTVAWRTLMEYTTEADSAAAITHELAVKFRGRLLGSTSALDYARYLYGQGKYMDAMSWLDSQALAYLSAQTGGQARTLYADILVVLGQYQSAIANYDSAVSEGSSVIHCSAQMGRSNAMLLAGRHQDAIDNYLVLLKDSTCMALHDLALYQIGEITFNLRDTASARSYYREYLTRFTGGFFTATVRERLAALDSLSGMKKPPPAKAPAKPAKPTAWAIQLGAYSKNANAEQMKKDLSKKFDDVRVVEKRKAGEALYLVWMGSFKSEAAAESTFQARYPVRPLPHRIVPAEE